MKLMHCQVDKAKESAAYSRKKKADDVCDMSIHAANESCEFAKLEEADCILCGTFFCAQVPVESTERLGSSLEIGREGCFCCRSTAVDLHCLVAHTSSNDAAFPPLAATNPAIVQGGWSREKG